MSLRTKVVLWTSGIIAGAVILLAALEVNQLVRSWIATSVQLAELAGQQAKAFLLVRLEDNARRPAPRGVDDPRLQWTLLAEHDERLPALLEATVAQVPSLVEISIADQRERVIASSDRSRLGAPLAQRAALRAFEQMGPWARFSRVFAKGTDYEVRVPIGLPGDATPVFVIQVLVSNVLLRDAIAPGLRTILLAGFAALLVGGALVYLLAQRGIGDLNRLGQLIDRIARGEITPEPVAPAGNEFAAVESKLNLLGTQFRKSVQDAASLRDSVTTLLHRLEETILLFDSSDRLMLCGGACHRLHAFGARPEAGLKVSEVFPPGTDLGQIVLDAFSRRRRLTQQRVKDLTVHVDFLGPQALVRIRDAEGARQLEQQLTVSTRLAAINRLTGGVAHEIKNPLNSIAARLALLESIVEEVPEAGPEIRVISQEIERLDRVVRTFLDFTHPVEMRQEDIDLSVLVQEIAALVQPEAARNAVTVEVSGGDAGMTIRGDGDLLRQALMNLARNALEAMPAGGRLGFELERLAGTVRLAVDDTGEGIPPEKLDRIFQLYYTTKKGGSGIGLAVTFRAVQLHGGRIEVRSEPGRGTRFEMSFPFAGVAA